MALKEAGFLEFNRDGIFINFIQAEGHLRNVSPDKEYNEGDWSCIVKHLADAEGHADEAVSHSLVIEGAMSSIFYQSLRDKIRNLRKAIQGGVNPSAAILALRNVRRSFESKNPTFDISKCKSCGLTEEYPLTVRQTTDIVAYPVKEILNSPSVSKSYNREIVQVASRGKRMASNREIATVYGSLWLGKGVSRLAQYVDVAYPLVPVINQKPSVLINIAGAVGGVLAGMKLQNETYSTVGMLVGAYLSTGLWDTIETMITPAVAVQRAAVVYRPFVPSAPRVVPNASTAGPVLMGG